MKILYIFSFIFFCISCYSQDYFSRIIPTKENPLIKRALKVHDDYFISTDFFANTKVQGGFIMVTAHGEVRQEKYENMDLSADPMVFLNDEFYVLGENPFRQGDSTFFLSNLESPTGNQIWYKEFNVESPKHNPRSIISLNNKLFVINVELESLDGNFPQEISIYRIDLEGTQEKLWKYNTDYLSSFAWQTICTSDNSLILSSLISKSQMGPYAQLIKINGNGEIIWNYEGEEKLDNGAVPTWATELSDSSIVQTYFVDKNTDTEYIINGWFRRPNKFIWLNKDGELMREKFIITEYQDFLHYQGLKKGKGDYFFAFGYLEDTRPLIYDQVYAHLTKFSNEGDTIWSRNFQHPSYPDGNIIHNIKDIIEEENGDITILAEITPPRAKTEVWLFKINSNGCYINDECEDMTTITSTISDHIDQTSIFPNPTSGIIYFNTFKQLKEAKLLDVTGQQIEEIIMHSNSINLSSLDNGVYFIHLLSKDGQSSMHKIIKI